MKVFIGNWGGRYPDYYPERLSRSITDNLTIPHEVYLIEETDYPGWWGKINVLAEPGPALWVDMDCVITGSLDDLIPGRTTADIVTARNWAQSGHGGCQSSVMYWNDASRIVEAYDPNEPTLGNWPPRNDSGCLWGDQEFLTLLRDTQRIEVEYFDSAHVVSYKYHCRQGVPDDARVVCFHGKPDPHEVRADWVKQCWG
jgi:hypothetical protein